MFVEHVRLCYSCAREGVERSTHLLANLAAYFLLCIGNDGHRVRLVLRCSSHRPVFIVDILDKIAAVFLGDDPGPEFRGFLLEFNCFLCQGGYLSHMLHELQHHGGVRDGVFVIYH